MSEPSNDNHNDKSYGRSPLMDALLDIRAWNALPPEVRAKAAAAYVEWRLSNPNDEWRSK